MFVAVFLAVPASARVAPRESGAPLAVPVTVYEDAGVARLSEVVTGGVPLPESARVRDVRTLRVEDESGAEVTAQIRPLSRWGAPVSDASAPLRWVLVDLPATVTPGGKRRFVIKTGKSAAEAPGALARAADGEVLVQTDAGAFSFSKSAPGPLALVARAPGDEKDEAVTGRATSVELEENGPLRACVLVKGVLDGGFEEVGGRHPLAWSMRWHFTARSEIARVQVVVENPDRPHAKPFNDRGEAVGKRFGSLALVLAAEGESSAEEAPDAAPESLVVEQGADGFEVRRGREVVKKGGRAAGWIAAGGTMLGMRSFAANHPKALLAKQQQLALEIFPASAKPQFLGGARAKTHDVWVRFPKQGAETARETAARASHPLRATVSPQWLRSTRALGALSIEDRKRFPDHEETLDRIVGADLAPRDGTIFDERRAQKTTGWEDYGDSFRDAEDGERRFGNAEFDFGWVLLRQYLREADHDRVWLEESEAVLRHVMDIDVMHTDDDAAWANHGVRKHDGSGFQGHSRGPDFSHFWVRGMLAFHLTTGDARAREVAVGEIGEWIAAREDSKRPGWLVYADEIRDVGWVLIALADLWEATGDPKWLQLAQRVSRTMVVPSVAKDGAMREAVFTNRRDGFMPWQQAYVADGMGRLCLALRKQGKRDAALEKTLKKMLDYLAETAWIDEPKTLHGETYPRMVASFVRADGVREEGDGNMSQALGDPMVWGWLLFGEARYREAALAATKHTFPNGPKRYFDESVATPAKNAAVRTYFGEAVRWMEQTGPRPVAAMTTDATDAEPGDPEEWQLP